MDGIYILGIAAACFLMGVNVFDEVRARRERKNVRRGPDLR